MGSVVVGGRVVGLVVFIEGEDPDTWLSASDGVAVAEAIAAPEEERCQRDRDGDPDDGEDDGGCEHAFSFLTVYLRGCVGRGFG